MIAKNGCLYSFELQMEMELVLSYIPLMCKSELFFPKCSLISMEMTR